MSSRGRQGLYLGLAGLALHWYQNILFSLDQGGNLMALMEQAMVNHASRSLTLDVSVAALTFLVWMWFEAKRPGMTHRRAWIVLTPGVAVAFAFPLFLMMREHRLQQAGGQDGT